MSLSCRYAPVWISLCELVASLSLTAIMLSPVGKAAPGVTLDAGIMVPDPVDLWVMSGPAAVSDGPAHIPDVPGDQPVGGAAVFVLPLSAWSQSGRGPQTETMRPRGAGITTSQKADQGGQEVLSTASPDLSPRDVTGQDRNLVENVGERLVPLHLSAVSQSAVIGAPQRDVLDPDLGQSYNRTGVRAGGCVGGAGQGQGATGGQDGGRSGEGEAVYAYYPL